MNDDKELEIIFEELPDAMASRLISTGMVETVTRIGVMHDLKEDQIDILQTIMSLAFLGKLSFDDIDQEIEDSIEASDAQLEGVKKDIENQIVIPFINELKNGSGDSPNPDRPTSRKIPDETGENVGIEKMLKDAKGPIPAIINTNMQAAQPVKLTKIPDEAALMPTIVKNQPAVTNTIMDSRLNTPTSLPKENVIIANALQQAAEVEKKMPEKKPYDGAADPYREPLA